MESAIFGLLGVVLGVFLGVMKDWWFQHRKTRKDAEYLAIQVSCELEAYAARCAEVVGDDGLCYGQPDEDGYHRPQTEAPQFNPKSFHVEWKSLPAGLMYEVLDFPYKAEMAQRHVSAVFEYAGPPDFSEGFEDRQLQYAALGIAAAQLATKLRDHAGLPKRPIGEEWDPVCFMEEEKSKIELRKTRRLEKAQAELPRAP